MARSSRRALVVSRRRACIPSERPSCHPRTSPMLPHPLSCPLGWVPGGCGAWAARSSDADSLRRRAALDRPHGRAPRGALPCAAVLTATPGRLEIRATPEHEVEVGAATAAAPPPRPPRPHSSGGVVRFCFSRRSSFALSFRPLPHHPGCPRPPPARRSIAGTASPRSARQTGRGSRPCGGREDEVTLPLSVCRERRANRPRKWVCRDGRDAAALSTSLGGFHTVRWRVHAAGVCALVSWARDGTAAPRCSLSM